MYVIARTQQEIDRVRNWAAEGSEQGSKYPGMSFEQGIEEALGWLFGEHEEAPDGG